LEPTNGIISSCSPSRIPFGRSAVDDAERDQVRAGRGYRFALDEARSWSGGVKASVTLAAHGAGCPR
jgi:hypothetical protein